MISKIPSWLRLIILIVLLAGFLHLTTPEKIPIGLLILPALLIFGIFYLLSDVVCKLFRLLEGDIRRRKAADVVAGSLAAVLMILQTTSGVRPGDVVLIGLIVIFSFLYVSRF